MKVVWMINADGINKVKVKNLQIDGGLNSGYNSIGVQLWSSQDSTVEGLVIKNMDDAAVQTIDSIRCNILNTIIEGNQRAVHCTGATELNMTNNIIRNNQSGIFGRITNSSILNNVIQGNNFNAIELDWGSTNNKINDNTIIDNAGNGISLQSGFGTVAVESKSNSIQNNTISYNGSYGIVLDGRNSVAVLDTQISNNVVTGNSQSSNNLYDNIALIGKCNNNTIQGNKCRKGDRTNKSRGGLGITNAASTNNVVINNDLVDSGVTYYFTDMGTGTKTTSQNYSGLR